MSNFNSVTFQQVIMASGIPCQIVTGKNPRTVIALNIGGYTVKGTSSWTKPEIEAFFEYAKCNGIAEAVKSVAKQKVCDAHGRTRMEELRNHDMQEMTYATNCSVQYYKRNLYDVFVMYCGLDMVDDDRKRLDRAFTVDRLIENLKEFNKKYDMEYIKANYIILDDNIVYSIDNMIKCIDTWLEENKIQKEFSKADKIKAIRAFEKNRQELQAV